MAPILPLTVFFVLSRRAYGSKSEGQLMEDILSGYDPRVRPVLEVADALPVELWLGVERLAVAGRSLEALLRQELRWRDTYLVWNRATYEGQAAVVLPASSVWTPRIAVLNREEGLGDLAGLGPAASHVVVDADGLVSWTLPALLHLPCPSLQPTRSPANASHLGAECKVSYGSHLYAEHELSLAVVEIDTSRTLMDPSSPWRLKSAGVWSRVEAGERGERRISDVAFTLKRLGEPLVGRQSRFGLKRPADQQFMSPSPTAAADAPKAHLAALLCAATIALHCFR